MGHSLRSKGGKHGSKKALLPQGTFVLPVVKDSSQRCAHRPGLRGLGEMKEERWGFQQGKGVEDIAQWRSAHMASVRS